MVRTCSTSFSGLLPLIVIAASLPLAAQQTGTRDNGAGQCQWTNILAEYRL